MEKVRSIRFANLTAPILAQMRTSAWTWLTLADIALTLSVRKYAEDAVKGLQWGPGTDAGHLEMKVNARNEIRVALHFWSARKMYGPSMLRDKKLDLVRPRMETMPETMLAAGAGRRVHEVVDVATLGDGIGMERVGRLEPWKWGLRVHLDTPYVQPSHEDLEIMRGLHENKDAGMERGST